MRGIEFLTPEGRAELDFVTELGLRSWYDMYTGFVLLPLADFSTPEAKAFLDESLRKFLDKGWVVELTYQVDDAGNNTTELEWWIRADREV